MGFAHPAEYPSTFVRECLVFILHFVSRVETLDEKMRNKSPLNFVLSPSQRTVQIMRQTTCEGIETTRVSRALNCTLKIYHTNSLDNLLITSKLDFSASNPKSCSLLNSSESRRRFNIDASDDFSAVEYSLLERLRFDIIFLFGVVSGLGDFTLKFEKVFNTCVVFLRVIVAWIWAFF